MVFNMCFPKTNSGGGNTLQRSTSEENRKNMEIEKMIRRDKKMASRQVKILLLGGSILPIFTFVCQLSLRCRRVGQVHHLEADAYNLLGRLSPR